MRNLKRALSLTLASVMLLGMMVVGTSAAAGYSDVDANDNVEAIEVLQAVEVMVGDDRGFGPDRPVTRNEMAVVMGKLLNLDYNYYSSTCPFTDVADWAKGWVGACAANGIVSGRGNGIYDGESTVTAIEAASMMMRALGYFKNLEDYADGFQVVTVRQGSQIGIFNMVGTDANTPMTRNQVAQMALNALRSEMVDFTGTPGIEVNGVKVGYKAEYTSRTSTEAKYNAIEDRTSDVATEANHKGQYYIQLGEQLYDGKLRLDDATDDFGRPSRYWEYDGKEIGTYMKKELLDKEWTVEVTGKDLYDQLGKSTIEDKSYDFFIYVDGEDRYNATDGTSGVHTVFNRTQMNKNNKAGVGGTGNGTLTQVFVDSDNHEVTIAVINTYLARAKADYNEKRDEVSFDVYALKKGTANNTTYLWKALDRDNDQKTPMPVSNEDFDVANVKESDSFLVTVANGEIQSMVAPEVISSTTLDSFKRNDNVVAEGTTYKYTTTAQYDVEVLDDYTGDSNYGVNLKDKHYNIYLDAYNNLIGIDLVENADNYVFITGVDSKTSNLAAKQYDANAIFLDGTMKTITFDSEKSDLKTTTHKQNNVNDWALANTWCTYTVSGDIYTLTQVANPKADGTSLVGTKVNNREIKVAQYYDKMNNVDVNSSTGNKIDVKNVSLRGASSNNFKYVYGNDETVYLNAEVKGIYTGTGTSDPRGVISKVTSVTTGIKNAGLEVMASANAISQAQKNSGDRNIPLTTSEVSYGSYVLYNNKGYVIAAVTVADDASASENLVYVHTDSVDLERYTPADDEWTWTRRVVNNGEEITLTEIGDKLSELKSMQQHNWYVVSYNAKGNVIGVSHAVDELATKTATKHEDTINDLPGTINTAGVSTVLYEKSQYNGYTTPSTCPDNHDTSHIANEHANSYGPKLVANTFYDITTSTTGFYVDDEVKVVFIQKNKNVWDTHFLSGKTDLENVIEDLITNDTDSCGNSYHYEVSAILEGGIAKTVIIRDLHVQGDSGQDEDSRDDGNETTLPTTSDMAVTVQTTGLTNVTSGQGRYDAAAGKLYLQFAVSNKPEQIDINGVTITDQYGKVQYVDIKDLKVQSNGTSYVYVVNYAATQFAYPAPNTITVNAKAASGAADSVDTWWVTYYNNTSTSTVVTGPATIDNGSTTAFNVTIAAPADATKWGWANDSTHSAALNGTPYAPANGSNLTARTATVAVTPTGAAAPTVAFTITASEVKITTSLPSGAYTASDFLTTPGITDAGSDGVISAPASGENAELTFTLKTVPTDTNGRIHIEYKVNGTAQTAVNVTTVVGQQTYTANLPTGNVASAGKAEVEVTSIELQGKVTFTANVVKVSGIAAAGTLKVLDGTTELTTGDFVKVGKTLTVTFTATAENDGVTVAGFTPGEITDTAQATTVTKDVGITVALKDNTVAAPTITAK